MEISKFLKMSFLIDGLVALVYGLVLLLIPDIHNSFFGFPYEEFAYRYIGTLFLGFAIGNLLAYRASSWENVEFVVWMNIVFLVLGVIVILYAIAIAVRGKDEILSC
jgi:peptidoglycan/LPS O-acetylase OafA/YrhL